MKPASWESRIVKPRDHRNHPYLTIIAASLSDLCILVERTGEIHPLSEAVALIVEEPSSLWVCAGVGELVSDIDVALNGDPLWTYKVTPLKRDIYSARQGGNTGRTRVTGAVVHQFGFRNPRRGKGHWHYTLDPGTFLPDAVRSHQVGELMEWGQDVRAWCQANGIHPRPTAGGLAGQLLKDPRFYPEPRRKVPRATNARARPTLPGNHYELRTNTRKVTPFGIYLDMRSAHHNCATDLVFPNANSLLARGHYRQTTEPTDTTVPDSPAWAPRGSHLYETVLEQATGLLLLRLSAPVLPPERFPLPFLRPGTHLAWVYTNELDALRELSVSIDGVEAAWVSFDQDKGLNRYAAWALTELAASSPDRLDWLKPTLLAVYGILAARPRVTEVGWKRAEGGQTRHYPAGGHGMLTAKAYISEREQEVPTVNVIHRGMIEAETRKRILDLARWLTSLGHRVLNLYADAVIVEAGPPLPLLPSPWSIKTELSQLRFLHPNAFHSQQMVRMPGVPRESEERIRRLQEIVTDKGTLPAVAPTEWLALSESERGARLGWENRHDDPQLR